MTDDSTGILFRCFLQEIIVSSSGMGKIIHYFSVDHPALIFHCRSWRRLTSKVPRNTVLERLSWRVTCPNRASFRLFTVARRGYKIQTHTADCLDSESVCWWQCIVRIRLPLFTLIHYPAARETGSTSRTVSVSLLSFFLSSLLLILLLLPLSPPAHLHIVGMLRFMSLT